MRNKKIIITGANGFLGRSLRSFLSKNKNHFTVYGIDHRGPFDRDFFRIDLADKKKLRKVFIRIRPDYIFHLAGSVASSNFRRLLSTNVAATYNLFSVISSINDFFPRIIIPGSAAEYGDSRLTKSLLKETDEPRPMSLYGLTKVMQTELALMFVHQGMDIIITRLFNITGSGLPCSFAPARFAYMLARIKKGQQKPEIRTRNLEAIRDFLDINDVCHYIVFLALFGNKGEIYNICRGKGYSIRSVLTELMAIAKLQNIKIIEDNKNSRSKITYSLGSSKKLHSIAKSYVPVSLRRSLAQTYSYYFNNV